MDIVRKMTLIGATGRKVIEVVIDTGASRTSVRSEMADAVGLPLSGEEEVFIDASGNKNLEIGGKLALRYHDKVYPIYGFISENLSCQCLLGMDFLSLYKVQIDARSGRLHFR